MTFSSADTGIAQTRSIRQMGDDWKNFSRKFCGIRRLWDQKADSNRKDWKSCCADRANVTKCLTHPTLRIIVLVTPAERCLHQPEEGESGQQPLIVSQLADNCFLRSLFSQETSQPPHIDRRLEWYLQEIPTELAANRPVTADTFPATLTHSRDPPLSRIIPEPEEYNLILPYWRDCKLVTKGEDRNEDADPRRENFLVITTFYFS